MLKCYETFLYVSANIFIGCCSSMVYISIFKHLLKKTGFNGASALWAAQSHYITDGKFPSEKQDKVNDYYSVICLAQLSNDK